MRALKALTCNAFLFGCQSQGEPMNFTDLNIIPPILKAIASEGYVTPTPIQEKALPVLFEGHDILASAQTGTGKTLAFAVSII